jgi:hypothetical protein
MVSPIFRPWDLAILGLEVDIEAALTRTTRAIHDLASREGN